MDAERQPSRPPRGRGFALRDPYGWSDLAGLARAGETLGYRALFLPEIAARDALAAVTGLASETGRLLMGPGIVPIASRSPRLLAMAAATAQERSGGRLLLGLGTGPSGPGALDRLREAVGAIREAFAEGSWLTLRPTSPAIWLAALGPRAVRLAGEVADGVVLNWCTPARVARAREELAEGAAAAGRDPAEIGVAVYVRAALGPGASRALHAAAAEYAGFPAYARQFAAMGLDPADPEAIARALCIADPDEGRALLAAHAEAGADLPVVYPVIDGGPSAPAARDVLDALAPPSADLPD